MKRRLFSTVLLAFCAVLEAQECVRVVVDKATVRLGNEAIAWPAIGTELEVTARREGWVGVKVNVGSEVKTGWINEKEVEAVAKATAAMAKEVADLKQDCRKLAEMLADLQKEFKEYRTQQEDPLVTSLHLRDEKGRVRATLGMRTGGKGPAQPALGFFDTDGKTVLLVMVNDHGRSMIIISDSDGKASLAMTSDIIQMSDSDGRKRLVMTSDTDKHGTAGIVLHPKNKDAEGILLITETDDGRGMISLETKDGKALLGVTDDYRPLMGLGGGKESIIFTIRPGGQPRMEIVDQNGKLIWSAP